MEEKEGMITGCPLSLLIEEGGSQFGYSFHSLRNRCQKWNCREWKERWKGIGLDDDKI